MRSSYKQNHYGWLFDGLITVTRPKVIVECGVLDGYSLLACAVAAESCEGKVFAYDLFDDYQFKHGNKEEIERMLKENDVKNVTLVKEDAFKAAARHEDNSVDFLHIDIANDGDKLAEILNVWHPKLKQDALFVFEGGSFERDQVEWMRKYNKSPIASFKLWSKFMVYYEFVTITPFPSVTICRKK